MVVRSSLVDIEVWTLAEIASNVGCVPTYERLLRRVFRISGKDQVRPLRSLHRKLGDDAEDPTYIFTSTRIRYRKAVGEPLGQAGCRIRSP
ncbi:MAG: hypothetical protein OXG64_07190 [Chloroflexi bacterium]|nr:hypothetical protein [Chloroflexota bacterium]